MQPEILYRTTDGRPFYLWDDGLYYPVKEPDQHIHHGHSYSGLMKTKVFQEEFTIGLEKIQEQEIKENAPDLEDYESILDFLRKIQNGDISSRKGAEYLFEAADNYWNNGFLTARKDIRQNLIQLSDIDDNREYRAFIERVATGKRVDGTYNYCREALEQQAKELLKRN